VIRFAKSSSIQFFGTWIVFYVISGSRLEIKFIDFSTISRIKVPDGKHLPVFLYLFQSLGRVQVIFFCFDDSEIDSIVFEEVVGIFLFSFASNELATIGKCIFANDTRIRPTILLELRIYVFGTCVGL
jgi:hypothetical protein